MYARRVWLSVPETMPGTSTAAQVLTVLNPDIYTNPDLKLYQD